MRSHRQKRYYYITPFEGGIYDDDHSITTSSSTNNNEPWDWFPCQRRDSSTLEGGTSILAARYVSLTLAQEASGISCLCLFPYKDWFIVKSCNSDNFGRSLKGDSVLGVHSNVVLDWCSTFFYFRIVSCVAQVLPFLAGFFCNFRNAHFVERAFRPVTY